MRNYITKEPKAEPEIDGCHRIREYVLKESFADEGLELKDYSKDHPVHGPPNISLVLLDGENVIGSVRLDKKFANLNFKENEVRLALFGIDPSLQGQGLGKIFFDGVKLWCQDNGITTIYTNARISAHPFWLKMGFNDQSWDAELECETEIQMILKV